MALPSSGSISLGQVRNELKLSGPISLGQSEVRNLAGINNGKISLNDLKGKSSGPNPKDCDYYFETKEDFGNRIEQICKNHNYDLSNVTLGFSDNVTELTFNFGDFFSSAFPKELKSTPKMMFCKNISSFSSCFSECSSLTTISKDLFKNCPNAIYFDNCFGSTNIKTIPAGLFDNCIKAASFFICFSTCYSLTTVPFELFDKCINASYFVNCFYYSNNITSALPDVWNKSKFPKVTDGKGYALHCTKVSNYSQIPSNFK